MKEEGEKREGKKETRENATEKGSRKGRTAASRNSATRNFRHKSNDPPVNFAGLALFSQEREGEDEKKERERTFLAFSHASKSEHYELARMDR